MAFKMQTCQTCNVTSSDPKAIYYGWSDVGVRLYMCKDCHNKIPKEITCTECGIFSNDISFIHRGMTAYGDNRYMCLTCRDKMPKLRQCEDCGMTSFSPTYIKEYGGGKKICNPCYYKRVENIQVIHRQQGTGIMTVVFN